MRLISLGILSVILTAALAIPLVFAEAPIIHKPDFLPGPKEDATADQVQHYFRDQAIPAFTAGFIGIIGGFSVLVLVWSGIRFITAAGEEEAITNAKKTATWAVVGFGIAILSYAIVATVVSLKFPNADNEAGTQEDVIYRNP